MTASAALGLCLNLAVLSLAAEQTRPKTDYSGDCSAVECHGPFKKHAVVHAPVSGGTCDACHEPTDTSTHRFTLTEQGSDLCLQCHDEHEGDVVHSPVETGPCTACHNPHASDGPNLLLAPTVGELCAECHEDITEELDFLHGPVAAGACTSCHAAHASDLPKLLIAKDGDLCVKCHSEMDVRKAGKDHIHEPVRQGCLVCHNPHGGSNRMNLAATPPELCLDCHDEVGELAEDAAVKHDAVLNGRACVNCHSPHTSKHDHLLLKETMPLCLSCHDKAIKSGEGSIANIAAVLANANPHGPIRDQDCVACHSPHGGDNFRMLTASYPASFYASYSEERYALCFECHDAEMLEDEATDELTNFRNGERNLHFLHVNRDDKGRTCRACHDPHASKHPMHIIDSVPFGEWRIPVNFAKTPTGGSCQPGCHRPYSYDRTNPVVNMPEPNTGS